VGVACDLEYPCAKFRLPRPFGFRVRADVRDIRQTDRRTDDRRRSPLNAPAPLRGGGIINCLIDCCIQKIQIDKFVLLLTGEYSSKLPRQRKIPFPVSHLNPVFIGHLFRLRRRNLTLRVRDATRQLCSISTRCDCEHSATHTLVMNRYQNID